MDTCYGCLHPFKSTLDLLPSLDQEDDRTAYLNVELVGVFAYKIHLRKSEGVLLSVGKADNNAIVVPQDSVAPHHLDIFYSQGSLWAESRSEQQTMVDGIPLIGTRNIRQGSRLIVGDAVITVV
jgi:hypothetical protein